MLHAQVQGNKWRKLKYNIQHASHNGYNTLLTFGGVYSNHIYATAAAAKWFGFKSIGVIRGSAEAPLTPTLQFALQSGMQLHYVDRETYRQKENPAYLNVLRQQFGDVCILPEGGTNTYALKGVQELVHEIEIDFNYIVTACGTGGTLAGMVSALKPGQKAIGFSALKGEDSLTQNVIRLLELEGKYNGQTFEVNFDYHMGGYAKANRALFDFIITFYQTTGIRLEPVYTGKMMMGLFDLIRKGRFAEGSVIVAVHTGGLQGLSGYPALSGLLH